MLFLRNQTTRSILLNSDLTTWVSLTQTINNSTTTTAVLMSFADKSILAKPVAQRADRADRQRAACLVRRSRHRRFRSQRVRKITNCQRKTEFTFNARIIEITSTVLSAQHAPLASTGVHRPSHLMPAASATQSVHLYIDRLSTRSTTSSMPADPSCSSYSHRTVRVVEGHKPSCHYLDASSHKPVDVTNSRATDWVQYVQQQNEHKCSLSMPAPRSPQLTRTRQLR